MQVASHITRTFSEDEELTWEDRWHFFRQDARQWLLYVPRLCISFFIKPDHDGIQCTEDLLYQYGQAIKHIPSLLRRLAFKTRTLEDELHEAMLRGNLRKAFHGFDLMMIGLGIVIGTGAFTLTGQAQAVYAGSAVLISYAVAGLACICAAACYAELCVEYPVSGSAFTYVMVTFGEYPAYLTMGMLLAEYVLGMAAVARGFSQYFAQLLNQSVTLFTFDDNGIRVDFFAFGLVLALSAALSFGVRESSFFLAACTLLKLFFIAFICIAGFANANGSKFLEAFPNTGQERDGVFQATAFIFFAYVAFDAVCNAVEETQKPTRIPNAIIGTVLVSTIVYMAMSASLSLIVLPSTLMECVTDVGDLISPQPETCEYPNEPGYALSYTVAFNGVNLPWMQFIVAITALLGITTSLLVGLYSVARLAMVAARTWLLPAPLARISPRTQTPLIAQMSLGCIIAVISCLVRFNTLSELVSLAALFAMWMVCNAVLFRRYYPDVKLRFTAHGTVEAELSKALWWMPGAIFPKTARRALVWLHLFAINFTSFGFVIYYRLTLYPCPTDVNNPEYETCRTSGLGHERSWLLTMIWVACWAGATISMFLLCPLEYQPKAWGIKWWLLPFMPSFAILLIAASAGSFQERTFVLFGSYFIILTGIYVFISMPCSYIRHFTVGPTITEPLQIIELVEVEGKYVRWDELQVAASAARRSAQSSYRIGNRVVYVADSNGSIQHHESFGGKGLSVGGLGGLGVGGSSQPESSNGSGSTNGTAPSQLVFTPHFSHRMGSRLLPSAQLPTLSESASEEQQEERK